MSLCLRLMDVRFTLQAVRRVPVIYWPWVWWQLFWLRSWCEATGRDVLWDIEESGKVWVTFISDDKADLAAWLKKEQKIYRAHWYALHNESGEMHLGAYHYWMGRIMECGARFVCWRKSVAEHALPALEDSS